MMNNEIGELEIIESHGRYFFTQPTSTEGIANYIRNRLNRSGEGHSSVEEANEYLTDLHRIDNEVRIRYGRKDASLDLA